MRACPGGPCAAVTLSSSALNLRRAWACTISTSTGSARQMSSSQVMECSKAAERRSKSGADSTSMRVSPQPGVRYGRTVASAIHPDEMKHGVLVDDGRLLHVLEALVILEVGICQRQLPGAMGLDQHAFEFDLAEAPIGAASSQRPPDVGDVGLAVADPTVRLRRRLSSDLADKLSQVGAGNDG